MVQRIDLEECLDEESALARESELLRTLRPSFNRAGVWPSKPRFFELESDGRWPGVEGGRGDEVRPAEQSWSIGPGVFPLRAALVRLLWYPLHPKRGLWGMPDGWFCGRYGETIMIPVPAPALLKAVGRLLDQLFVGRPEPLIQWVREQTAKQIHAFELAVREMDLETVITFASRLNSRRMKP